MNVFGGFADYQNVEIVLFNDFMDLSVEAVAYEYDIRPFISDFVSVPIHLFFFVSLFNPQFYFCILNVLHVVGLLYVSNLHGCNWHLL